MDTADCAENVNPQIIESKVSCTLGDSGLLDPADFAHLNNWSSSHDGRYYSSLVQTISLVSLKCDGTWWLKSTRKRIRVGFVGRKKSVLQGRSNLMEDFDVDFAYAVVVRSRRVFNTKPSRAAGAEITFKGTNITRVQPKVKWSVLFN